MPYDIGAFLFLYLLLYAEEGDVDGFIAKGERIQTCEPISFF